MAKAIHQRLKDLLFRREQSITTNEYAEVREAVILAHEIDNGADIDVDIDYYRQILDAAKIPEGLWDLNAERLAKRKRDEPLARREEELRVKAEELEHEAAEFDRAEAARHNAALIEGERKREAARMVTGQYIRSVEAKSDLIETASPVKNFKQLMAEQRAEASAIAGLRTKLDPGDREDGVDLSGTILSNVADRPARLARQLKQLLSNRNAGYSGQRIKELKKTLGAAEAAVEAARIQLAEHEQRHAEITAALTPAPEHYLVAENFAVIRKMPRDAEAERKAHAARFGMSVNDPGFAITRG